MTAEEDAKITLRGADVMWRRLESEIVVLDGQSWEYLELNASGSRLWECLEPGATKTELAQMLIDTYGLDPDVARADVDAFIEGLRAKDLLA